MLCSQSQTVKYCFSKYSIKLRLCALNFSSCNKNLDKSDLTGVIYAKGYGTIEVSFEPIMKFAHTIVVFLMSILGLFSSQVEESKSEDENQEEEGSTEERGQLLEITKRLKEANDAIGYMIEAVEWNSDGQIFLTKKHVACNDNFILAKVAQRVLVGR